jgi:anti-sigma regulatory factor (Ser/Thr protein kinase)
MALDLTFDVGTLSRLRTAVFDEAAGAGMPHHRAADVVIAVHELAANALRHGAGGGLLTIRIEAGQLRCRVSDAGPERIDGNDFRTITTGQPWPVLSGHGLWLVRETADEVTMASGPDGYSVTALFRLSA